MKNINNEIVLDFHKHKYISVPVKQHDENSRILILKLYIDEETYLIPPSIELKFRCTKSNNTCVLYDIPSSSISGNTITFSIPSSALTISGEVLCDICLFQKSDENIQRQILSTPTFHLQVEQSGYDEKSVLSSNDYSSLNKAFDECKYHTGICIEETAKMLNAFNHLKAENANLMLAMHTMIAQNKDLISQLNHLKTELEE